MTPIFKAKIENNKVVFYDRDKLTDYLINLEGKVVEVVIRKPRIIKQRSILENNYMWGVVYKIISEYTGHTSEDIHEYCKLKFLGKEIKVEDKVYKIGASTANLTTVKFEEYLDKVRMWAMSELSLVVPLPNEIEL